VLLETAENVFPKSHKSAFSSEMKSTETPFLKKAISADVGNWREDGEYFSTLAAIAAEPGPNILAAFYTETLWGSEVGSTDDWASQWP